MNFEKTPSPTPAPGDQKERQGSVRRRIRYAVSFAITGLIVLWLLGQFVLKDLLVPTIVIPYSDFKIKLVQGQILKVTLNTADITGEMKNPDLQAAGSTTVAFETAGSPASDPKLVEQLQAAGIPYAFQQPSSPVGNFVMAYLVPLALLGGFGYVLYRQRSGGGVGGLGGAFRVGKSRATEVKSGDVLVSFKDVGGADEALAELQEIIQFLKTPEQFARLGGRVPKGVLLVGPPGTGKTLLAKATAGEAHVPFFETSGSEFVEMFVGVGAARVRDLFEKARKAAPAIVFIDEIDTIGQSRAGAARMGNNDEREQTLNQLLAEIDGFQTSVNAPVIIMAASNRPEVLDPALLRAGRFDRQIAVGNPDLAGRVQILNIHSTAVKLADDFDVERAARMTPGFTGADLANIVNEAALLAARRNADAVGLADFEAAIVRVVAGLEKRQRVMNERERTAVAYHEAGHALVASLVPYADPVSKISIVPHSRGALGYTLQLPTEDRYLLNQDELQDRLAVMLGGRAAEKVKLNLLSTGASDDITRATELARRMVTEFGMSHMLGSVRYAGQQLQYLGGSVEDNGALSPQTRQAIDQEIQRLVTEQYERAQALLNSRLGALETLTALLLEQETVDGSVVRQVLEQA
jgi:cell division protease FtsH